MWRVVPWPWRDCPEEICKVVNDNDLLETQQLGERRKCICRIGEKLGRSCCLRSAGSRRSCEPHVTALRIEQIQKRERDILRMLRHNFGGEHTRLFGGLCVPRARS